MQVESSLTQTFISKEVKDYHNRRECRVEFPVGTVIILLNELVRGTEWPVVHLLSLLLS